MYGALQTVQTLTAAFGVKAAYVWQEVIGGKQICPSKFGMNGFKQVTQNWNVGS